MKHHDRPPHDGSGQPFRPSHPTVSSTLLGGVRQMDQTAWSRLVETFGGIVYRWCRSSGVSPADAADVVQEVFTSVARGIGGFERRKPSGSFRSWLATITRNRVRDHFRRLRQREAAAGGTAAMQRLEQQAADLDSTISTTGIQSALVRRLAAAVQAQFAAATWQAFWMTAVQGRPASEVAEALGMSTAAVYQSKSRVLRRLRQRLDELPE